MKLLYIAGAYRSRWGLLGRTCNIIRARRVARWLWGLGYAVICPHSNSAFMDRAAPAEAFLRGDLLMLKHCDAIVLLPGFAQSEGAQAEYFEAQRRGIPKFRIDDPADVARLTKWGGVSHE